MELTEELIKKVLWIIFFGMALASLIVLLKRYGVF